MEASTIADKLSRYFADRSDVIAAYLFGSTARGDTHASSDVDVGILLASGRIRLLNDYDAVFAIQNDLERLLGCEVDVVPMDNAGLDLLHRILRDGTVVHDRQPRQRVEFELKTRTEYFDWLPVLRSYRRAVLGKT